MEIKIQITLDDNKNIKIATSNNYSYVIKADDMTISAEELYKMLSYKDTNTYKLKDIDVSEDTKEYKIIKPFYDLLSKLINQIEQISDEEQQREDVELDKPSKNSK